MSDPVNHPAHYTEHPSGVECIQITEHMGFNLGNAVKYIWRADLKGSAIQDLEKARWYIDRELVRRGVATEPAVERCQSVSIFRERCALAPGHDGRHAANGCAWGYPPAPAEPAEEETKAEVVQDIEVMQWDGTRKSIQAICDWVNSFDHELDDPTISYCFSSAAPDDVLDVSLTTNEGDFVRVSDGDFIVRDTQGNFYRRDRNAYATVADASPVVPAPTETGPWQNRVNGEICVASPASGLPYTIGKFNDHGDFVWHSSSAELPEGFAPFVAAEKG